MCDIIKTLTVIYFVWQWHMNDIQNIHYILLLKPDVYSFLNSAVFIVLLLKF